MRILQSILSDVRLDYLFSSYTLYVIYVDINIFGKYFTNQHCEISSQTTIL